MCRPCAIGHAVLPIQVGVCRPCAIGPYSITIPVAVCRPRATGQPSLFCLRTQAGCVWASSLIEMDGAQGEEGHKEGT